jgi:hypothetical protein
MVWRCEGGRTLVRERQLRRRLTDIGVGYRFTVNELAGALAQERGRPIRLRAASLPDGGLTGGLLVTLTVDFVAYRIPPTWSDTDRATGLGSCTVRTSGSSGHLLDLSKADLGFGL